eukprot:GHUV01044140.1.p1 GENE.GHUV01044140.1~~GHUV01044140.1.p1  ORF type:complete len:119 (+),score=4.83 GHUV01044140.1:671-1027(+)
MPMSRVRLCPKPTHLCKAQCCSTAGHDRHFEQWFSILQEPAYHGVTCFMVRHCPPLFWTDDLAMRNSIAAQLMTWLRTMRLHRCGGSCLTTRILRYSASLPAFLAPDSVEPSHSSSLI